MEVTIAKAILLLPAFFVTVDAITEIIHRYPINIENLYDSGLTKENGIQNLFTTLCLDPPDKWYAYSAIILTAEQAKA